jgi:hypothetical protein
MVQEQERKRREERGRTGKGDEGMDSFPNLRYQQLNLVLQQHILYRAFDGNEVLGVKEGQKKLDQKVNYRRFKFTNFRL